MASRAGSYWRMLVKRSQTGANRLFTNSTAPKMKSFAATSQHTVEPAHNKKRYLKGEFFPVYVALGMILLSVSIGVHTVKQQMMHAPNVRVSKKKRESLLEVEDPDEVAKETDNFVKKSFFRRVAHVRDHYKETERETPDPIRGDPTKSKQRLETLKSVGVEPSTH